MNAERPNVVLGLAIEHNTRPEAVVAHYWAGAAAYFSDRKGVDFLGKCDETVARRDGEPGLIRPGHNKYDIAYSMSLKPDVVVSASPGFLAELAAGEQREAQLEPLRSGPYRVFAELFDDPTFLQEYSQNLVGRGERGPPELARVSRWFHGVFVRQGTLLASRADQWTEPAAGDGG